MFNDNINDQLLQKSYKYKENDPRYRGEILDDHLQHGVNHSRGCTDFMFLIIFALFWCGMGLISVQSYDRGDPNRLASPFDSSGNQCGHGDIFKNYKYIYFTSPSSNLTNFVCVENCPKYDNNHTLPDHIDCKTNQQVKSCQKNEVDVYDTYKLGKICLPSQTNIFNLINNSIQIPTLVKSFNDIKATWEVIVGCTFIAFFLGFLFTAFIRHFAGAVIWMAILIYILGLSVLGIICIDRYNKDQTSIEFNHQTIYYDKNVLLGVGTCSFLIAFISIVFICCIRNQIKLVIAIMKVASDYTQQVKSIFLVPVMMFIVGIGFTTYWTITIMYISSSGQIGQFQQTPFSVIDWETGFFFLKYSKGTKRKLTFFFVGLFWNVEFLIAFTQYVIASSCGTWYFNQGKNKFSQSLCKSFVHGIMHIGSLALGSLIITFIWILKLMVDYLHRMSKNVNEKHENCLLNYYYKCIHCCLDCFERFIRFITHNTWIMIAINGKGFCTSAHDSFYLMLRNYGRFSALSGVSILISGIGKLFISIGTATAAYLIITESAQFQSKIYYPWAPTLLTLVIAYFVGTFFLAVYYYSAETILTCYCIDEEVHIRQGKQCQYCPESLKDFMDDAFPQQNYY